MFVLSENKYLINMKKIIKIMAMAVLFAITLTGCSKKNDASPNSSSSSWTSGGTTYAAATTVFTNNTLLAIAKSNSQVTIGILFNSRPAAGAYSVVSNNIGNSQCTIQTTGAGNNAALSQGGGTVTVTISDGKIHAAFSAIPMVDVTSQPAGTISGNLIEQ
jgi:hypothetical protein